MTLPSGADYGQCPCSGTYQRRTVEVRMTVEGEPVVLEEVPQGACPTCGSRVYKLEVLERATTRSPGTESPGRGDAGSS